MGGAPPVQDALKNCQSKHHGARIAADAARGETYYSETTPKFLRQLDSTALFSERPPCSVFRDTITDTHLLHRNPRCHHLPRLPLLCVEPNRQHRLSMSGISSSAAQRRHVHNPKHWYRSWAVPRRRLADGAAQSYDGPQKE